MEIKNSNDVISSSRRPATVQWAVGLSLTAIGIGLINTVRTFSTATSLMSPFILIGYITSAIAIWLFLLYKVAIGRNWARILFVVMVFLSLLGIFSLDFYQKENMIVSGIVFCQAAFDLVAAVLLFISPSSRWYRKSP